MSEERDFKNQRLHDKDVAGFVSWYKEKDRALVRAKFPKIVSSESQEAVLERAVIDVATASKRKLEREKIKAIPADQRSQEQKARLTELGTLSELTSCQSLAMNVEKGALERLEKIQTAANEMDDFVRATVEKVIFDKYLTAVAENPENRKDQVEKGLGKIKEMMTVSLRNVELRFPSMVMQLRLGEKCADMEEAEDMIIKLERIRVEAEEHKALHGGTNRVTDELLVTALCVLVESTKHNDIPTEAQNLLNTAKMSTEVVWSTLSSGVATILRALSVDKELERKMVESKADYKTAFSAKKEMSFDEAVEAAVAEKMAKINMGGQGAGQSVAFNTTSAGGQQQFGHGQGGFGHNNLAAMPFGTGSGYGAPYNNQAFMASQQPQWQPGTGGQPGGGGGGKFKSQGPCYDYQNGMCYRGNDCRFQHGTQNSTGGGRQQNAPPKRKVCISDGACWNKDCKFDHPSGTASTNKGGGKEKTGSPYNGGNEKRARFKK